MPIIRHYKTDDGRNPFDEYLRSIKDPIAKAMIATRVARMATGNYGDCKVCRDGVSELRIIKGLDIACILATSPTQQMVQ